LSKLISLNTKAVMLMAPRGEMSLCLIRLGDRDPHNS
jgi:hypothetical protein